MNRSKSSELTHMLYILLITDSIVCLLSFPLCRYHSNIGFRDGHYSLILLANYTGVFTLCPPSRPKFYVYNFM